MGGDALTDELHIHITRGHLKDLLDEFGDNYAWLSESWTQGKQDQLIDNLINKLVDIS